MPSRTENWKGIGTVTVTRNSKGQFVSWERFTFPSYVPSYGKQISVYGHASNGVGRRYDFFGSGKDLQRAVICALKIVPKRPFVKVSARDFVRNPYKYGERGHWVDRKVES